MSTEDDGVEEIQGHGHDADEHRGDEHEDGASDDGENGADDGATRMKNLDWV